MCLYLVIIWIPRGDGFTVAAIFYSEHVGRWKTFGHHFVVLLLTFVENPKNNPE